MRDVYIVDAVRTPIGRCNGSPAAVRPDDLAGTVAHQLARKGGGTGVATLCIGVGQGLALVLER
ncbi:hypothetical protein [Streptomyces sp. Tue6028]|uniref:hypothetical protein n=1 Tax=Streptomyces sp. Tue6028 TaxID=2036037 RepID=UPI003EBEBE6C